MFSSNGSLIPNKDCYLPIDGWAFLAPSPYSFAQPSGPVTSAAAGAFNQLSSTYSNRISPLTDTGGTRYPVYIPPPFANSETVRPSDRDEAQKNQAGTASLIMADTGSTDGSLTKADEQDEDIDDDLIDHATQPRGLSRKTRKVPGSWAVSLTEGSLILTFRRIDSAGELPIITPNKSKIESNAAGDIPKKKSDLRKRIDYREKLIAIVQEMTPGGLGDVYDPASFDLTPEGGRIKKALKVARKNPSKSLRPLYNQRYYHNLKYEIEVLEKYIIDNGRQLPGKS